MNVRFVLVGLLTSSLVSFAQAPDPCATVPASCATLIQTHATSEVRIPNTAVDVVVGVSSSGKDMSEVQRALTDQSNKLLAYLKAQQVERLITAQVSFAPDTKNQKSGPEKTVGYNGRARISFRTKPDKAADLLAGVLVNGANVIESAIFTPTEKEISEARRHLSEDATKTAVAQADAIAIAADMKVISIRDISVDANDPFMNVPSAGLTMLGRGGDRYTGPLDTAAGDQQLSIRVDVRAAATR